ncbi:putative oxygenase MesX [Aureimonas frigidaquae]|uniref:DUF1852 domain-containing protein n=1 Tax=Aureimonas frigidaquae TaxID=424757 RepID=A0A0P0Z439_9HYPH|nr:putative oxygenase MesX [Aureimonas frigidaquae]BAT28714.1 hypothetical protein [Aureimonas frigidaquae]
MSQTVAFTITSFPFDEDYTPSERTRITTNFANLARGAERQANLRNTLRMINSRFNAMAAWDNPGSDRYSIQLDVISVGIEVPGRHCAEALPFLEMLETRIIDQVSGRSLDGIVGNNFSSYLRDYDFSIVLPEHNRDKPSFSFPGDFGDLHGRLFKSFVSSTAYRSRFRKPPVICISASTSRTYRRTANHHPIMGVEYLQDDPSPTDRYFAKMGLQARFFMPAGSAAPLAFYVRDDLLADYSNLELLGTISTMETFQRIYRPEIYNANSAAGSVYRPSLSHEDYSLTRIVYDREERSRLAVEQGRFAEDHILEPYRAALKEWSDSRAA